MGKQLRQLIIQNLWNNYRSSNEQMLLIKQALFQLGIIQLPLDHFAVIDLPGPHTGIHELQKIFSLLGFVEQGKDYLSSKQNDFLWMTENDSIDTLAKDVLPQVVVADFRLDELPPEIRKIIFSYSSQSPQSPYPVIRNILENKSASDFSQISNLLEIYFTGRDWPLPNVKEFKTVHEFNELLAWVLVFGRVPNHFTLSIHLLKNFENLTHFHRYITEKCSLTLNNDGGTIKGGPSKGIAQSSTEGQPTRVNLLDGSVEIPLGFVEFVWRFPQKNNPNPQYWQDYFTGFIAQHADHVIESLYVDDNRLIASDQANLA